MTIRSSRISFRMIRSSISIAASCLSILCAAQAPNGFSYQAAARNANGYPLPDRAVNVRFAIHQNTSNGAVVFAEQHATTTSAHGLFSLVVGQGTAESGTLSAIDWSNGPYFLEVGIDTTGGTDHTTIGLQQLFSVPYALHAASTDALRSGQNAGDMLRWNGTTWEAAGNLHNTGSQVALNTATPHASAAFQVDATDRGLLPPRMSSAQRDAISAPAPGLVIFNTTTGSLQVAQGPGAWSDLGAGSCQPAPEAHGGAGFFGLATTHQLNATPAPPGSTGQWSIVQFGSMFSEISDVNDPNAMFTSDFPSTSILRWTVSNACGSAHEDVRIEFQCPGGSGDCDGDFSNGCETDLLGNVLHCSGCGINCALPNAISHCVAGQCFVQLCQPGYVDLDGDPSNGCEFALPTCFDGIRNGQETGVDCGGPECSPCVDGQSCGGGGDCQSGTCINGRCIPASCVNGVQDGNETGVDCGGGSCFPCAANLPCNVALDCIDGICVNGLCVPATCTDGVLNGNETGVDCGGSCPPCPIGFPCGVNSDCQGVCVNGICYPAFCGDGVRNGNETSVDCGGSCPSCP